TTPPMVSQYWSDTLLFDNVLTGDYERVNPNTTTGNYAGGNPLVHIRAIPEGGRGGSTMETPLPFTFYDRYTPAGARKADRRAPQRPASARRCRCRPPRARARRSFRRWRHRATLPAGCGSRSIMAPAARRSRHTRRRVPARVG